VVEKLGLKAKWLKTWITQNRVPHVRSGVDRGVRFTAADILEIGRMLPQLLGGRRGGHTLSTTDAAIELSASPRREPSADAIAGWAQLSAHRPRLRASK
jgi:hypothetical protein